VSERLVRFFWVSLVAAVPFAFFVSPGFVRWIAIGWLGLTGALFSLANWLIIVSVLLRKGSSSMAPPVGGVLVCLAIGAVPLFEVRRFAPLGLVIDPWFPAMLGAALWSWRPSGPNR